MLLAVVAVARGRRSFFGYFSCCLDRRQLFVGMMGVGWQGPESSALSQRVAETCRVDYDSAGCFELSAERRILPHSAVVHESCGGRGESVVVRVDETSQRVCC